MSSSLNRSPKRRRRRVPAHHYNAVSSAQVAAEERFLQQAIQNSKLDKVRAHNLELPNAPVFFATIEDFRGNPLQFVEKIRPVAEKYGICKIVPPPQWNPESVFSKWQCALWEMRACMV
jgi:uncharacterized membrane protein YukC